VRVGLFGGAFDPPHTGHLIVADGVREALALDRVLFLPYARGPHRSAPPAAPAADRLAMLRLVLSGTEGLDIEVRELDRGGASYTIDTLRERQTGASEEEKVWLIMGSDQLRTLTSWRGWEEVLSRARIAFVERPGAPAELPSGVPVERVDRVGLPRLEISSTDIRERVRVGRTIRYLVPEAVAAYIEEHGLYR